jgi:hypothetical protein
VVHHFLRGLKSVKKKKKKKSHSDCSRGVGGYELQDQHDLIPASIHHQYDSPQGIGAFASEIMQTAPMP